MSILNEEEKEVDSWVVQKFKVWACNLLEEKTPRGPELVLKTPIYYV